MALVRKIILPRIRHPIYVYAINSILWSYIMFLFSAGEPLPWSTRMQIALDSARGLEYIHEHTVPVYIHRDIKSPNILIDKNFRAKVENVPTLV